MLTAEDRIALDGYVARRGPLHSGRRELRTRLPTTVGSRLHIVFHGRERRRLNDNTFGLKATTLDTTCAACLRAELRWDELPCDEDSDVRLLAPRRLVPTSPWISRVLDLDAGTPSYF